MSLFDHEKRDAGSAFVIGGVAVRLETPADAAFLERLFLSTRWDELAASDWSEDEKARFLRQQFALQRKHYTANYLGCLRCIVLDGGREAGRIYVQPGAADIRLVDISLLDGQRNKGTGTRLLRGLLKEAKRLGKSVTLNVERTSPAKRLYERLGFTLLDGGQGLHDLMIWPG